MMVKQFMRWIVAAALGLALAGHVVAAGAGAAALDADAKRPNVLFIAVDDLRPEINCFGAQGMHTPNLDRLAARGVRFDRAYCNIAVCGASRASLMTGLRPTPTRFTSYRTWAKDDAPGVVTLPQIFKNAGYETRSNGKVYHHRTDDPAGWTQKPWGPDKGGLWYAKQANRDLNTGRRSRGPAYENAPAPDADYPDFDIASKTIRDLKHLAKSDQPFFLACGFYKPHLPFVAPGRYWERYPVSQVDLPADMSFPKDLPKAFSYNWGEMRSYHRIPKSGPVDKQAAHHLIAGYRACVSFIDAQVGRVLDELDRLDLAKDTIIVLWGDHGWQLGEHGFWCKHTNFEVATRVPIVVVAPGVKGGRATQRLVETVDLYPTLCDLANLPKPDHLHGQTLTALLADVTAPHKDAVFTRHGGGDAIRTQRYRYMEMRASGGKGKLLGVGLFDLQTDPAENHNIANDPATAPVAQRLRGKLTAMRKQFYSAQ